MGKNVYASVKSYSKRGHLLKKADFQTLSESRDLEELMTRIKNSLDPKNLLNQEILDFERKNFESNIHNKQMDNSIRPNIHQFLSAL